MRTDLRLRRPRSFGDCWLGCVLWDQLGLSEIRDAKPASQRGKVLWRKVLRLLAINRLCDPGSEFAVHRRWFLRSAMKLNVAATGLTPRAVLKSLATIQLVDVHIPTTDGRELVMPRCTEPEAEQAMILEKLKLPLPKPPPARIRSGEIIMPPEPST